MAGCKTVSSEAPAPGRGPPTGAANAGGSAAAPATGTTFVGAGVTPPVGAISIDATNVIRSLTPKPLGINLNYLRDNDSNRSNSSPLTSALKTLGVRVLRYPGGEKSDWQFWSQAPWNASDPQVFGWYQSQVSGAILDFDTYMSYVQSIGATPYIVTGYDSQARTGHSTADYLANAVNWVRYANITKGYGIKYWEIGNENWNNNTGTAAEIAAVVTQFSQAMKAVDPTIRIGCSGNNTAWWQSLLSTAAPALDFLVISNYPSPTGYSDYAQSAPGSLQYASGAANAIESFTTGADQQRLTVIATEFNAVDWTDTWSDANDLGHAMVAFEAFGQLISVPKLELAMFWTTRWMDPSNAGNSSMYALDQSNNLLPQGQAVAIWGQYLLDQLIQTQSSDPMVATYASYSATQSRETVFLVNRSSQVKSMPFACQHLTFPIGHADVYAFSGQGPTDSNPTWQQQASLTLANNIGQVQLAPYSVTVLDLKP